MATNLLPRRLRSGAISCRLVVILAALAATAGCAKRETPVDRGTREQTLLRAIDVDPPDLDPQVVTGIAEAKIFSAIFERLVRLDEVTQRTGQKYFSKQTVLHQGITLGLSHFMNARKAIMMVNGERKKE